MLEHVYNLSKPLLTETREVKISVKLHHVRNSFQKPKMCSNTHFALHSKGNLKHSWQIARK